VGDITLDEVLSAYYDCRKNKRNTTQQIKFEFNLESNIYELYDELKTRSYKPSSHIYFIITKPKPREVWAANFRDRIVHHVLYNRTKDIENSYINHTYACLKNKGTLNCAYNVQKVLRQLWHLKDNYRFVHVDIANFFVSIDKTILKNRFLTSIEDEFSRYLVNIFIEQDPTENYYYKGSSNLRNLIIPRKTLFGKKTGLPIGNLTSQLFANFYLNDFDHFCGSLTPFYFRYMDDMLFIVHKKTNIRKFLENINKNLNHLNLKLNDTKTKHNRLDVGINFVGYIIRPFSIYVRNSTKYRAKRAINTESINSYFGLLRKVNTYNLRKHIATINNLNTFYYQKIIL
jgi:RNA-directed DNA polymerase